MRVFLSSLALIVPITVFGQFTAIPDANFESALIVQGYDTLPVDGQILTANISSLTFLDVSNKNISDLSGIEDFSEVRNLDLGNNVLTHLDLSQNPQLKQLFILYNPLVCVNLQNGNNENMEILAAFQCPNLTCIQVDDALYSDTSWINDPNTPITEFIFDPQINFSQYCDDCNVGIDDFTQNRVTVYPNPTSNAIRLQGLDEVAHIFIYDSMGSLLLERKSLQQNESIPIDQFASGILIVKIKSKGKVYWHRILKK